MNFVISLDYELFFGKRSGSVRRCLVEPTDALCRVVDRHGGKLSFFVDAGYLLRLRAESTKHEALRNEYDELAHHLELLVAQGHELQLHIHPHWEDSFWKEGNWNIDTRRYRLHDFSPGEIGSIVRRYREALGEFCPLDSIRAYRAGGWVLQPFSKLAPALLENGIEIDSTVFEKGQSDSGTHYFDFRSAPEKSIWRFDSDPLVEESQGRLLEVSIASHPVQPTFFWKLGLARKLGRPSDRAFGDGSAIPLGRSDLIKKLVVPTWSVVSIDGRKIDFLPSAYRRYLRMGRRDFVVIGHPKALTPHSIARLDEFLSQRPALRFASYRDYRSLQHMQAEAA